MSNVTFIDQTTDANRTEREAVILEVYQPNLNPFGPVIEENNIIHKPNRSTPVVPFGPLDQTPLWTPRGINGPIVS